MSMPSSVHHRRGGGLLVAAAVSVAFALAQAATAHAQTLDQALSRAYASNPTLNSQRAAVRAIDEQVPQALSGYRPTVSVTTDIARAHQETQFSALSGGQRYKGSVTARGVGIQANQPVFDGFRAYNQTRTAESNILAARQNLLNSEQNVLFDAAQAYMDVLRDYAILDVRRNNADVLKEELKAARERFQVGEVTRTDTAQAEAALEGAKTQISQAEAQLNTSRATYRQVVGDDIGRPRAARSIDRLLPKKLDGAIALSQRQHPAILAAFHGVDAATLQIRVIEANLLPQLNLEASAQRRWDDSLQTARTDDARVGLRLTVPIYQGGLVGSQVRQAKQTAGQRRLEADTARDQVRQAVVSAWGTVQATSAQITSAQAQIEANQVALNGVREEAKVGQRTTLDVLNAQQAVLDSRVSLIIAQHDRVVGAYALLSAVGWLTAQKLGLRVVGYDPNVHYDQIRDKWMGLRTPDGR